MKLVVYADPHWSVNSSIVRGRGEKYSIRLENLIKSINFVEDFATENNYDAVVCLGDFFDTASLSAEEITALGDIKWSANAKHFFIVGNHEIGKNDNTLNSSNIFKMSGFTVVDKVFTLYDDSSDTKIIMLPYILESNRKPLSYYCDFGIDANTTIMFSHNDIKGIKMGAFESKEGFSIDEIQQYSNLFVNGHLHNHSIVADGIINLGNLTGQNFGEDAEKYPHMIMTIDTVTHEMDFIENPFAFNFYKLNYSNLGIEDIKEKLKLLKETSVITINVPEEYVEELKNTLNERTNIVASRVLINLDRTKSETDVIEISTDHIKRFVDYVTSNIGNSNLVLEELSALGGVE